MSGDISLVGWDTAFAVSYTQANLAIAAAGSTPPTFDQADEGGRRISGQWGDWSIKGGGDGQNLWMTCPISSGTAFDGGDTADLADGIVSIEVKLDKIPDPHVEGIMQPEKGRTPFKFVVATTGTELDPAVAILDADCPGAAGPPWEFSLPELFDTWFNENIASFNHVFAVLMLNEEADTGDYGWLKPTSLGYACADAADGSLDKSVLAVLCMTGGRSAEHLAHQIDRRILEDLDPEANSAFAISRAMVLRHILMPGAVDCIPGSQLSDFQVTNDDYWIENKEPMTLGTFTLDSGSKVKPKINAGDFQISVQNGCVVINVTNARFNWPDWRIFKKHLPGEVKVSMNWTLRFAFELKPVEDGWVFIPAGGLPDAQLEAYVEPTKGVANFEFGVAIGGALLGFLGGKLLTACFESGGAVAEEGAGVAVKATETEMKNITNGLEKESVKKLDGLAADSAAAAAGGAGSTSFNCAALALKFKIWTGLIACVLGGAALGQSPRFLRLLKKGEYTKLPHFEDFAAECAGATTWPQTPEWRISSTEFRGALIIAGTLES